MLMMGSLYPLHLHHLNANLNYNTGKDFISQNIEITDTSVAGINAGGLIDSSAQQGSE